MESTLITSNTSLNTFEPQICSFLQDWEGENYHLFPSSTVMYETNSYAQQSFKTLGKRSLDSLNTQIYSDQLEYNHNSKRQRHSLTRSEPNLPTLNSRNINHNNKKCVVDATNAVRNLDSQTTNFIKQTLLDLADCKTSNTSAQALVKQLFGIPTSTPTPTTTTTINNNNATITTLANPTSLIDMPLSTNITSPSTTSATTAVPIPISSTLVESPALSPSTNSMPGSPNSISSGACSPVGVVPQLLSSPILSPVSSPQFDASLLYSDLSSGSLPGPNTSPSNAVSNTRSHNGAASINALPMVSSVTGSSPTGSSFKLAPPLMVENMPTVGNHLSAPAPCDQLVVPSTLSPLNCYSNASDNSFVLPYLKFDNINSSHPSHLSNPICNSPYLWQSSTPFGGPLSYASTAVPLFH